MSADNVNEEKKQGKPKFQKGAFKPIVEVNQISLPYENHGFNHDNFIVERISEVVTNMIADEVRNRNGNDIEDVGVLIGRMFHMMMSVKLANSLSPMQENEFGNEVRTMRRFKPAGPTRLMEIIDGFGFIDEGNFKYVMRGQTCWSFSYFAKAVLGEDEFGGAERAAILAFNPNWINPLQSLRDLCIGQIDGWACEAPPYNVMMGEAGIEIRPPRFRSGAAGYAILVHNAPKPPNVANAINILVIIEQAQANAQGRPNGQQTAALAALGVVSCNWNNDVMQQRYATFMGRLIDEIQGPASARFAWGQISGFKAKGMPWQLSRHESMDATITYEEMTGINRFMARTLCGTGTSVIGTIQRYRLQSETIKSDLLIKYIKDLSLTKQ